MSSADVGRARSSATGYRRAPTVGVLFLGVLTLVGGCAPKAPYTSLSEVPGLTSWRITYEYRDTAHNGGCESGAGCRTYGVALAPQADLTSAITDLIAGLRRHGWSCAQPHSQRQAALIDPDGVRFVELEPVADLQREVAEARAFFDDAHSELAKAAQAAQDNQPAIAVHVIHSYQPDRPDLDNRPLMPGLCR